MSGALAGKRVAVYARYSSALQHERSVEEQVRRCVEFARASGAEVQDELVFVDMAISAASLQRPGFEQMMKAVDQRAVDVILVEDVSRLTRDVGDGATIFKRLQYAGVPLIGVADGINTELKTAKLTFTMSSLVAEMYLDTLRDKTLRGLEGQFRAGYSTGGLPLGYKSIPQLGPDGDVAGNRVVIDEDGAAVVRRIFDLYLEGTSLDGIARRFNEEEVPSPRAKTKHRRKGWVASTVREMLRNEAYVGIVTFKKRCWVKVPGTNTRRPKKRDQSEVLRSEYPERRIITPEVWDAVQRRLAEVRSRYTSSKTTKSAPRARTSYPLSGLLICAACSAPMVVSGGSRAEVGGKPVGPRTAYYRCGDSKKRGICKNVLSVREDVARIAIYAALRTALFTPAAVAHLRKRIAERLGESSRVAEAEMKERLDRLARTEQRIRGLVTFIADGDHSTSVRDTLRDLEAQAVAERAAIQNIKDRMNAPVDLPTPDRILERAQDLDVVLAADPVRAREALRRMFDGGRIMLTPGEDGVYVAEATFLPLVALAETTKPPARSRGPGHGTAISCAGRI